MTGSPIPLHSRPVDEGGRRRRTWPSHRSWRSGGRPPHTARGQRWADGSRQAVRIRRRQIVAGLRQAPTAGSGRWVAPGGGGPVASDRGRKPTPGSTDARSGGGAASQPQDPPRPDLLRGTLAVSASLRAAPPPTTRAPGFGWRIPLPRGPPLGHRLRPAGHRRRRAHRCGTRPSSTEGRTSAGSSGSEHEWGASTQRRSQQPHFKSPTCQVCYRLATAGNAVAVQSPPTRSWTRLYGPRLPSRLGCVHVVLRYLGRI